MKDTTPKTIYLKEYQKPDYLIPVLDLDFSIQQEYTRVKSRLTVRANYTDSDIRALVLNGQDMKLISVAIDGEDLESFETNDEFLTIQPGKKDFILEIETEIEPQNNKALEGLYQSGDIFCTQNEPEGFRKITYFLDRSDVMSVYTTRIEADKEKFPILLSNGNKVADGDLEGGRHFVVWNDPFKKPSYLFALVAGDLALVEDSFTTCSGKEVKLEIFVDHGNEDRSQHALDSLKKAMKWDEDTFGLEYDLDIYMIVAVDAFNMGAMENKGLNIFNTSCALANTKTATDGNFQSIEAIIAHEYFHNWTGNRITCRDWFQLTLKEGLTVFRDQQFSMDMTSRTVKRIEEVNYLRNSQFTEDSGPTAHPIKPESYIEINNFYTPTVYRKGAEVIRMIHTLIGVEGFRKGMDKYFELFDGQAVTTEDFVHAMELGSGFDFTHFKTWYCQAGTPRLDVSSEYDQTKQELILTIKQSCPPTAETATKKPYHMPFKLGLLDTDGNDLPLNTKAKLLHGNILELTAAEHTFVFTDIVNKPVPSLLRDFCAPVIMNYDYTSAELAFLLANDNDQFNRYEAGQRLAMVELEKLIAGGSEVSKEALEAFGVLLADDSIDYAFKAEAIVLPSITTLVERMKVCDYQKAYDARDAMRQAIADAHQGTIQKLYNETNIDVAYCVDPAEVGRRRLKNICLAYLNSLDSENYFNIALNQFNTASNMTDEIAGFGVLADFDKQAANEAVQKFYDKWSDDTLVMNKWFAVQASSSHPNVLAKIKELESSPAYDSQNPNKIRSLVGAYVGNVQYHAANGEGYSFLADKIIEIDAFNPSMSSGLSRCFRQYARMDEGRKGLMKREMERILAGKDVSKDVYEIVTKTLAQ
jgi:aminopeptidase N